jgi:PAS domain S-box-containing protein
LTTLSIVLARSEREAEGMLLEASRAGFVLLGSNGYEFTHDRVQEAAYRLIPEMQRPETHVAIARALASKMSPADLQERIFQVVDQYGRGLALVDSMPERKQVAELHLAAGNRAMTSTAYDAAMKYFRTGRSLLWSEDWQEQYELAFALELRQAECEFLTGNHAAAEAQLASLSERAQHLVDHAAVVHLQLELFTTLGKSDRGIEVALSHLHQVGIPWVAHPSDTDLREEMTALNGLLDGRPIDRLIDLPRMSDPVCLGTMNVLASLLLPALITDRNLEALTLVRMASLSIQHGNCDASCYAYAQINVVLGLRFGDYRAGLSFGELGHELVENRGLDRFRARAYTCFSCYVLPWTKPFPASVALNRRGVQAANAVGDVVFMVTSRRALTASMLVSGHPLEECQSEAEQFLESARKSGFDLAADAAFSALLLIRELRGLESEAMPDRQSFERHLVESGAPLVLVAAWYWIHQMQARYLAGDQPGAMEAAIQAGRVIGATERFVDIAEYRFYGALIRVAACDSASASERAQHLEEIQAHRRQIAVWAESCPENFAARAALVAAEVARLEGRALDAQRAYEDAIRQARNHGLVQLEAIASEIAARFHAGCGLTTGAEAHLRNARACYLRWGADGKVRQLDALHPHLSGASIAPGEATLKAQLQDLDLAAVIEMSQMLSGEIVLDRLIERLMTVVVEHAGAVRGLLLLPYEGEMRIASRAWTGPQGVTIESQRAGDPAVELPESLLRYVTRSHQSVALDDALNAGAYANDTYIQTVRPRSVLCLPLVNQNRLVGVLYLENTLAPSAFSAAQRSFLALVASQAAISLENATLYFDLAQSREQARRAGSEFRRAFDAIPAFAWTATPDGKLDIANKQWHDYTGIAAEEAADGWVDSFHPDDLPDVVTKWQAMLAAGIPGEVAARVRRPNGESRRFLVRAAPLRDESGSIIRWYGTHTDIDDLKRAEDALSEAQSALARVGRLTAMGELTVSIAHEVNQPLMAIVTNAGTCMRWLDENQLDVAKARQAAERIVREGHRAGEIVASIRTLAQKSRPKIEKMDLHSAILEVLALMRGELHRRDVSVVTDLAGPAQAVLGDRVQLQQVIMNLVMNSIEAMAEPSSQARQMRIESARADSGYIAVSVSDSGAGFDPESGERLFEAFFTTKPSGIGLGLSICRSIIEAHGGELWASPNLPRGSVFHFTVPAVAGVGAVAPAS